MSNARFSITPSKAVRDPELSDSLFRTLAALGIYGDENGWCWPGLRRLASDLNKSKPAVSKDVKLLREKGYLNVYPQIDEKGQHSNRYQIRFDYPPPLTSEINPPLTSEVNPPLTSEVNQNVPLNVPLNAIASNDAAQTPKPDILDGILHFASKGSSKVDLSFLAEHLRPLGHAFIEIVGKQYAPLKSDYSYWRKILNEWYERGFTPQQIQSGTKAHLEGKLSIKSPASVTYAILEVNSHTFAIHPSLQGMTPA